MYLANFSVTPYTVFPSIAPVSVLNGTLEPVVNIKFTLNRYQDKTHWSLHIYE